MYVYINLCEFVGTSTMKTNSFLDFSLHTAMTTFYSRHPYSHNLFPFLHKFDVYKETSHCDYRGVLF